MMRMVGIRGHGCWWEATLQIALCFLSGFFFLIRTLILVLIILSQRRQDTGMDSFLTEALIALEWCAGDWPDGGPPRLRNDGEENNIRESQWLLLNNVEKTAIWINRWCYDSKRELDANFEQFVSLSMKGFKSDWQSGLLNKSKRIREGHCKDPFGYGKNTIKMRICATERM